MVESLTVPLSENLALTFSPEIGGHRVTIANDGAEMGQVVVPDLQRLLKRAGSVVAIHLIELSNNHRTIVVKFRGRLVGRLDKASLVGIM